MSTTELSYLACAQDSDLIVHGPDPKAATACGIRISLCNCISVETLFIITTLAGSVLLILGALALVGYLAPASGGSVLLQHIKSAATFAASKLGSDLFTLAIVTTAVGAGLGLPAIGLIIKRCINPASRIEIS